MVMRVVFGMDDVVRSWVSLAASCVLVLLVERAESRPTLAVLGQDERALRRAVRGAALVFLVAHATKVAAIFAAPKVLLPAYWTLASIARATVLAALVLASLGYGNFRSGLRDADKIKLGLIVAALLTSSATEAIVFWLHKRTILFVNANYLTEIATVAAALAWAATALRQTIRDLRAHVDEEDDDALKLVLRRFETLRRAVLVLAVGLALALAVIPMLPRHCLGICAVFRSSILVVADVLLATVVAHFTYPGLFGTRCGALSWWCWYWCCPSDGIPPPSLFRRLKHDKDWGWADLDKYNKSPDKKNTRNVLAASASSSSSSSSSSGKAQPTVGGLANNATPSPSERGDGGGNGPLQSDDPENVFISDHPASPSTSSPRNRQSTSSE